MKSNYLISGLIAPLVAFTLVMLGSMPQPALAAGDYPDFTFSYTAPELKEDGSDLQIDDIQGYKIYIYKDNNLEPYQVLDIEGANTLSKTFEFTEAGKYLSAVSTVTTDGHEGKQSAPIIILVEIPSISLAKPPSFGGQDWTCSATCKFEIN